MVIPCPILCLCWLAMQSDQELLLQSMVTEVGFSMGRGQLLPSLCTSRCCTGIRSRQSEQMCLIASFRQWAPRLRHPKAMKCLATGSPTLPHCSSSCNGHSRRVERQARRFNGQQSRNSRRPNAQSIFGRMTQARNTSTPKPSYIMTIDFVPCIVLGSRCGVE